MEAVGSRSLAALSTDRLYTKHTRSDQQTWNRIAKVQRFKGSKVSQKKGVTAVLRIRILIVLRFGGVSAPPELLKNE